MSLLFYGACVLAAFVGAGAGLVHRTIRQQRQTQKLLAEYEQSSLRAWRRADEEYERRCDYEKALGLPFWDEPAVEQDLWARTSGRRTRAGHS